MVQVVILALALAVGNLATPGDLLVDSARHWFIHLNLNVRRGFLSKISVIITILKVVFRKVDLLVHYFTETVDLLTLVSVIE